MDIVTICTLFGIPVEYTGIIIGVLFLAYSVLEYMIGKTDKVKANSLIEAIYNGIKALLSKSGPFIKTVLIIALAVVVGCSGAQTTKPHEIGKATAESILYEARILQNSGKLSAADFEKVKRYYDRYKLSQDFIIDTRIALIKSYDATQKLQYDAALRNLPLLLKDLMDLAAGFGIHAAFSGGD